MKSFSYSIAFLFCTSLYSSMSHGAIINYSENINGDLDGTQAFSLSAGVHTIAGTVVANTNDMETLYSYGEPYHTSVGIDDFGFTIADDTALQGITVTVTNAQYDSNIAHFIPRGGYTFTYGGAISSGRNLDAYQAQDPFVHDIFAFSSYDPVNNHGPGAYEFRTSLSIGGLQIPNLIASYDYSVAITTVSTGPQVIPVPGAFWLFGSGLIGLVGFARSKKA